MAILGLLVHILQLTADLVGLVHALGAPGVGAADHWDRQAIDDRLAAATAIASGMPAPSVSRLNLVPPCPGHVRPGGVAPSAACHP